MSRRLLQMPGCKPLVASLLALALVACQSSADLSKGLSPSARIAAGPVEAIGEPVVRGQSTLVVDAVTGKVLFQDDADGLRYPASLSKLMTLYLAFEAMSTGRMTPDTEITVSPNAAAKPPSKLGLRPGSKIRLGDAVQVVAVKSTNDIATAIAENIGGSEAGFANAMNRKARELGMTHTHFANPSGLPDPQQISTARDLARLALAIRSKFPRFVAIFAQPEVIYDGRRLSSTNHLLGKVAGVDGMKTGYVGQSGFHLIVSAQRGAKRILVVVMGGATGKSRDARAASLVETYLQ